MTRDGDLAKPYIMQVELRSTGDVRHSGADKSVSAADTSVRATSCKKTIETFASRIYFA